MDTIMNWINGSAGQYDKLQHMRRKAKALHAQAADINTELEHEELRPGKKRKRVVDNWLHDVDEVEIELQHLEQQLKYSSATEPSCIAQATKLTKKIGELIQQGSFTRGLSLYDHRSSSVALVITDIKDDYNFEDNKRKIMSWLTEDDTISIVGVHGPGGVGKTALLKEIHNDLLEHFVKSSGHIYWVAVSHGTTVSMLQDQIAEVMDLSFLSKEKNKIRKAATLSYEMMRRRNIVLVLDDVWENFPLEEVGIPVGENNCKLILTTRSLYVCRRMKCQEIVKVKPLSREEAWKLFAKELGNEIPCQVKDIAQLVAAECAGLPLGIIVMAGSMRGVDDIQDWHTALEELRNTNEGQADMERDVFPVLKLSYERLKDPKLRLCFLLCVLYPRDSEIKRDELITLFRSEGLLDGIESWQKQFDKAHSMLNKLENVCLLEKSSFGCVKMHNLIREMAIRITKVVPRYMIAAGAELKRIPSGRRWTIDLDKVSLMQNCLSEINPGTIPMCPCLSTLLLQRNPFTKLPDSFFIHMKGLKVLNLSKTSMTRLPSSISELWNLKALLLNFCTRLFFVPSIVKLTNLRELNFSFCWSMKDVPHGMERLAGLRFLDLEGSKNLCWLLCGSLSKLSNIQCLKLDPDMQSISGDDLVKLRNLERLEGCRITDLRSFNRYVKTQHFQQLNYYEFVIGTGEYKRIHYGSAENITSRILVLCSRSLEASEEGLFFPPENIQNLQIHNCDFSVSSLVDALPSVQSLTALSKFLIRRCRVIEFIWPAKSCVETKRVTFLHHGPTMLPLQCLKELILTDLQDFRGLVKEGVTLPRGAFNNLEILVIKFCPKIKKLFTSSFLKRCLDNLQELEVEECEELQEIIATTDFDDDDNQEGSIEIEGNANGDSDITRLPKLKSLHLRRLPKLATICQGVVLGNCSIERISVEFCSEIENIFMSSLALNYLRNLRDIKVVRCKNLKEIVATPKHSNQKNTTELLNLRALVLNDLPFLTSFLPGKLPSCRFIEQITLLNCPRLKRLPLFIPPFSSEQPSTFPCLREIKTDRAWWESLDWDIPHLKHVLQPFVKLDDAEESSFKIIKGSHLRLKGKASTTGVNSEDISSCSTELRDKDVMWDPDAEVKYKEIEENVVENLSKSVVEDYPMVLNERSRPMGGLRARSRPMQSEGESSEQTSEMILLQQAPMKLEGPFHGEIEELKASNNGLRAEIERMKVEAIERENKLREELMEMLRSQLTLR